VLAEYDASGEAKWVSSVTDGRADSIFRALAVDAAGNVFAVGSVGGKQRYVFGPGVEVTGISSRSNAVIVKCDKSGNAQWAKGPFAGSSDSDFKAVTVDGTGSPFAAGYIRGIQSYTFDPGSSVTGVSRAENALLVAYTSSGQAQWARSTTDGLGWSQFCAVAADDEGNLYTAGAIESAGSVTFGSGSKVGSESSSVVLVKYDSSGTARCARSVKEGSTGSAFNAIVIDGTGTLTTAGARIGAATCTFGPGVVSESGKETPSAALLVRYR
jgi:hypothetical protein